jgi:hypothetical protein
MRPFNTIISENFRWTARFGGFTLASMSEITASGGAVLPVGCRRCGYPIDQPDDTLSSHATSDGETSYSRCCACGLLQVWTRSGDAPARLVTRSATVRLPA